MNGEAQTIWAGLEFRKAMFLRQIEPLNEAQMRWAPGSGRNSIAWQLWHIAEVEDNWVRALVTGEALRFPFGIQMREAKEAEYPEKERLLAYFHEVRNTTRRRLDAMTSPDFEREVMDADFGKLTVRDVWAGVVTSFAWHAGQTALTAKLMPESPVRMMQFQYWQRPEWKGKGDGGGTRA